MTKKLEDLFQLPTSFDDEPDTEETVKPDTAPKELITTETLDVIERIETALPQVKGLESSDQEIDEIADLAKAAFNNLMDLGMQTDPRFSAEIFSVGSTMLGHALTAKTAKINKKLKMIDLQLKKADLDRKIAQAAKPEESNNTPLGVGQIVDRNELLRMLAEQASAKNASGDK